MHIPTIRQNAYSQDMHSHSIPEYAYFVNIDMHSHVISNDAYFCAYPTTVVGLGKVGQKVKGKNEMPYLYPTL
jgi:hypothetical protein